MCAFLEVESAVDGSQTSGGTLDDILQDRTALESHFGIHLNSDESDLDISFSESDWNDSGMTKIIMIIIKL